MAENDLATDTGKGTTQKGTPAASTSKADGGQTGSAESNTESFTALDVAKLPKELQETYKSMQGDYTKKMQEIAKDKEHADAYRKIASDEAFVKYWNGLSKQQQKDVADKKGELEISDEEFADAFTSKEKFLALQKKLAAGDLSTLQGELQQTRRQLDIREAERVIDMFSNAKDPKTNELLHPLYNELEDLGLIDFYLSKQPATTPDKHAQVLDEVYKAAKATYDKIYSKGKEVGLGRVVEKINASSETPTNVSATDTGIDFKTLSPREQVEAAVAKARKAIAK